MAPTRWLPVLAIVVACENALAPGDLPATARAFNPPSRYSLWWSLLEQCSGRTGDLSAIQWFENGGSSFTLGGTEYDGYWWKAGNRILVGNAYWAGWWGEVIRHEMLHALLRAGDHPLAYFADRCDGFLQFDAPESYKAYPTATGIEEVDAKSALAVSVTTLPESPRMSEYDGWFLVLLTIRNTKGQSLWVRTDGWAGDYIIEEQRSGTYRIFNARRVFFAPGQTRRVVLDALVDSGGTYHIVGGYAGAVSRRSAVTVSP